MRYLYISSVGQVVQAARRLATGWTARVRARVSEWWRFSSLLRVQTCPGVHSASYKMSTGVFPGYRRPSVGLATLPLRNAVAANRLCGPLHPHPPWAFMPFKGIPNLFYVIYCRSASEIIIPLNNKNTDNVI